MIRRALLLPVLLAFSVAVCAEEAAPTPDTPAAAEQTAAPVAQPVAQPVAAVPQPQAAASVTNAITRAAVAQGILTCAARINQVTNYLGFNERAGAVLMPNAGQQADQRLFPLMMEIPTDTGAVYVSATFAPNQANGCGATYDAVAYWPLKCDQVAAKQFSGFKKAGSVRKDVTILDGGVATKVFLMTAGAGCMSIKKELVL